MGKNKEKKNKRTFLNVQLKRFLSLHLSANNVLNMSTGLSVSLFLYFFFFKLDLLSEAFVMCSGYSAL